MIQLPVASFTIEANLVLANYIYKCPLNANGRLANLELTSVVKEATGTRDVKCHMNQSIVEMQLDFGR